MRFCLIDRITEITSWTFARAIKNVSLAEDVCVPNRLGVMRMPGLLVAESMLQTAAWLMVISSEKTQRPVILSIDHLIIHREPIPGDQVVLTATIVARQDDACEVNCAAEVDGEQIAAVTGAICKLLPTYELENRDDTETMVRLLTRD